MEANSCNAADFPSVIDFIPLWTGGTAPLGKEFRGMGLVEPVNIFCNENI